ncbi:hypothetical protein [Dysgonomonas sp. 25]|uniref:hypothetical protein n=1 Tax=Dysgonomonas sp. 25 TaxID=2302933 RepID=UPI0013D53008|nr:hypothetical protein [Dysgonomonas sp. 25]NDV68343.1 hypothetical protein [Dysgonomonas sp. 25]
MTNYKTPSLMHLGRRIVMIILLLFLLSGCKSENNKLYVVTYSAEVYSRKNTPVFIMYRDAKGEYHYEETTRRVWRKDIVFDMQGMQASLLVMPRYTFPDDDFAFLLPHNDNIAVAGRISCNGKYVDECSETVVSISLFLR